MQSHHTENKVDKLQPVFSKFDELLVFWNNKLSRAEVNYTAFYAVQKELIHLVNKVEGKELPLRWLIMALTYICEIMITGDIASGCDYYTNLGLVYKEILLKPTFPKVYLENSRLFSLLIYADTNQVRVSHNHGVTYGDEQIIKARAVFKKFINQTGFNNDSESMLAEMTHLIQLSLVPLTEVETQTKQSVISCIDHAAITDMFKMIRNRYKDYGSLTTDAKLYFHMINMYECIVSYNQIKHNKKIKSALENKMFLTKISDCVSQSVVFLRDLSPNSLNVVLHQSYGNVQENILKHYLYFTLELQRFVEVELLLHPDVSDIEVIVSSNRRCARWVNLHTLLQFKNQVEALISFFHQKFPAEMAFISSTRSKNKIQEAKMIHLGLFFDIMNSITDEVKSVDALVEEMKEAPKKSRPQKKMTAQRLSKNTKSAIPKANKKERVLNENNQKTKPENIPDVDHPIVEKIKTLIKQKQFVPAAHLLHNAKRDAEFGKDLRHLIQLYMSLGDLYLNWSQHTKSKMSKEIKLRFVEKYHQRCIDSIEVLCVNEPTLAAELFTLKQFLQDSVRSCREKFKVFIAPGSTTKLFGASNPSPPPPVSLVQRSFQFPGYVEDVAKKLIDAGFDVYLVGGSIRDYPEEPQDYDFATNASMQAMLTLLGDRAKIIGNNHPVVQITGFPKLIEIGPLQASCIEKANGTEVVQVQSGGLIILSRTDDLSIDAERRAITCNALYYDMKKKKIIDFYDGQNAVLQRSIRFIGDHRVAIQRDPTLILRVIRLMARYGYTAAPEVEECMLENIDLLGKKNVARVYFELDKTLQIKHTSEVLALLMHFEVLTTLFGFTEAENTNVFNSLKKLYAYPHKEAFPILQWCILVKASAQTKQNENTPLSIKLIRQTLLDMRLMNLSPDQKSKIETILTLHLVQNNEVMTEANIQHLTPNDIELAAFLTGIDQLSLNENTNPTGVLTANSLFKRETIAEAITSLTEVHMGVVQDGQTLFIEVNESSIDTRWLDRLLHILRSIDSKLSYRAEDNDISLTCSSIQSANRIGSLLKKYFDKDISGLVPRRGLFERNGH